MPLKSESKAVFIMMIISFITLLSGSAFAEGCVPSAGKTCYTYDDLNRLKRADYADGYIIYNYDKLGNIIAREASFNTATTSSYGPWQWTLCNEWDNWCWYSYIDTCNDDSDYQYVCQNGVNKTCEDVADYSEIASEDYLWRHRIVTCGLGSHNLTISMAGAGSGTVTSSPVGISCGADCTEPYAAGSVVTLTATPSSGSSFAGWSGGACSGTGTCAVTMNADKTVTATFNNQSNYNLTVSKAGDGSGTVTSSPAGISCGTDCTEPYAPGTKVTLTATHPPGSKFGGWSGGGCSGTGKTCVVTVDAAVTVLAFFTAVPPATTYGPWSWVWCDPWDPWSCWDSGTDYCNSDDWNPYTCTAGVEKTCHDVAYYAYDEEFDADEWVYRSVTCTAKHNLTISKAGTGSGTVTSSPAGISCGADCAEPYAPGTTVTLTATPSSGSTFEGWSLSGCSGTGPCVATMDTSIAVTATFNAITSIYGTWQAAMCNVNYSSSSCWNSGIDSCNGDDWNAYTCPSGTSKTCNDVAYYEYYYYDDDYYYEDAGWSYRTVSCVSGQ